MKRELGTIRDQKILSEYQAQPEGEKDLNEISRLNNGLSVNRIRQILKDQGVNPKSNGRRGPKARKFDKETSDMLNFLSVKVRTRMHNLGELKPYAYSELVGLSPNVVIGIRENAFDVTLSQLVKLAAEEGVPLHEYLKPTKA